jgi:Tfp pilus assembly protein PilF
MLSEIHSNANHDSLSLYYVKKALEINPDYPPALLSEVDFYRRSQHFDTYFSKMYAIYANPNIPKEMKTEYLTALLKVPNFTQIFQQQFDTLFSQIRTKPYAEIEPLYGNFLIQTGRSDSASVVFQQAAAYFNTEILWETFLGFLYYRQAWDKLETHATEALRIFPERINFITLKAIALWQKNKIRQAIELLEKAIPLVKNNKEQTLQFCSLLGDLYQLENNIKKTTFYYEQALAIDSTNISVLNNYAYFLSEHGKDLEKAYRMSEKTIAAEPNNATYLDTLGWILYKLNQYVAAKTIFRRAMIYGGTDSAVILDHYGDVLYAAGEKEAAVVYWELSYKKVPNPEVKKKIP